MNRDLEGKNAIISGARSGIGLSVLRLFAKNGCNCWALIHREDSHFDAEVERIQKDNDVWIRPVYMDLGNPNSLQDGMKGILKEKKTIDILVNAAGIVSPNRLFVMTKMDDIRQVMQVNFFSVMEISQMVCRSMMRQNKGSIINIASISAWGEDTSQIEYAASKAAIVIATKKMARELGTSGIRVNAVAPGLTDTKMLSLMNLDAVELMKKGMALHRLGTPDEIAEVCLFLASEKSSFITGETIKVDGGGNCMRLLTSSVY